MASKFTCYVVGEGSLLLKCGEILLDRGHKIYGIISPNPTIKNWAADRHIEILELNDDLANRLKSQPYDYLLSIVNLSILPDDVINSPQKMAINFHDGPLPKYAGVNVTAWAIMNQENTHGITWHKITTEPDKGDILKQVVFDVSENETALSLNAACFEKGLSSFAELVEELANGTNIGIAQNLGLRTYYGKHRKPARAAIINWNSCAEEISALVRALDFGRYANPLGLPKVKAGDEYFIISEIRVTDVSSIDAPGVITEIDENSVRVATKTREIEIGKGLSIDGYPLSVQELIGRYSPRKGLRMSHLDDEAAEEISRLNSSIAKKEKYWVDLLWRAEFPDLHCARNSRPMREISDFREERIDLDEKILNHLTKLGVKPQIVLGSAFGIFIGRRCGRNDFTLGYSDEELMESIGGHGSLFAEYVPLRVTFDYQASFHNALRSLVDAFEKARENKTYSRDIWGRYYELKQRIEKGGQPVFPVNIFFSKNRGKHRVQNGSIVTLIIPADLNYCSFVLDSSAIAEEDIRLLKAEFINLLGEISRKSGEEVGKICILSADERKLLLGEWNDTRIDFPASTCIHQMIEEQAAKTPQSTAVIFEGNRLTYEDLNGRSNQVARRLKELGVEPESLVGLCLHRSVDTMAGVLGILKAGGAYVPLDPSFPQNRISYMIEDSKCSVILTEKGLRDGLNSANAKIVTIDAEWDDISKRDSGNLNSPVTSDNLAYVIYTSGSTGKPKGVMVEHRNVVNFFTGMDACIENGAGSTWLAVTSLSFDISVLEILWTLTRGFTVVMYAGEERDLRRASHGRQTAGGRGGHSIPELMRLHNVTHFQCTPSMASMLMLDEATKSVFGRLRKLLIGGETFPGALAAELRKVVTGDIVNMYGPTETTIWSTTYKLRDEKQNVPIGRPIANTTVHIQDENLQPVPIGVPGELMIGGAGVVRGYLNLADLTSERFIQDPFSENPKNRVYRTGDLARYLPDGNIEFMGRMDHQVKIRGYRIELGEIEAVLNDHPAIYESVVIARGDVPSQKKLVAYVIPRDGMRVKPDGLRDYLKRKLPDYMVPVHVVALREFPKTPNKKIDRKALPPPEKNQLEREAGFDPPRTEIEEAVAAIWAEALGVNQVGRNGNFFELGGNSLSACGVILNIRRTCRVDLPLLTIFLAPTVVALAEKLEKAFQEQAETETAEKKSDEGKIEAKNDSTSPSMVEQALMEMWRDVLGHDNIGRDDDFFKLGGTSLIGVKLLAKINHTFKVQLPIRVIFQARTVLQLTFIVEKSKSANAEFIKTHRKRVGLNDAIKLIG
jgi:amino acid adenylation domain-containing protein